MVLSCGHSTATLKAIEIKMIMVKVKRTIMFLLFIDHWKEYEKDFQHILNSVLSSIKS